MYREMSFGGASAGSDRGQSQTSSRICTERVVSGERESRGGGDIMRPRDVLLSIWIVVVVVVMVVRWGPRGRVVIIWRT